MNSKQFVLISIGCSLLGGIGGASITNYRMGIEQRYQKAALERTRCYGLLRQIQELDQLNTDKVRDSIEHQIVLKVFFAEQSAGLDNKIGYEARKLLKMVSQHRKSPSYIKAENEFRSRTS